VDFVKASLAGEKGAADGGRCGGRDQGSGDQDAGGEMGCEPVMTRVSSVRDSGEMDALDDDAVGWQGWFCRPRGLGTRATLTEVEGCAARSDRMTHSMLGIETRMFSGLRSVSRAEQP
jgi:hypothetical protein